MTQPIIEAIFGEGSGGVPQDVINAVMKTLPQRAQEVLALRFKERLTYVVVGQLLFNRQTGERGVSEERARQLTMNALRMLRHPSRSGKLRPYLAKEDKGLQGTEWEGKRG